MSFSHTLRFAPAGANDNDLVRRGSLAQVGLAELDRKLKQDLRTSHAPVPVDCRMCGARARGLCRRSPSAAMPTAMHYKSGDRFFRAGESLFDQGEEGKYMYNLVTGWVVLYALAEEGRRQILHFAMPGAVLGYCPGECATMNYSAEALTDAVVCAVPLKDVPKMFQTDPALGESLAQTLARQCELARDHLVAVGRLNAIERVSRLILELFIRFRGQWPNTRTDDIYLPLTQEHIADAVGLTGVHINRVLRELRARNILEFRYKKLRVLDAAKLAAIAQVPKDMIKSWAVNEP